MFPTSAKNALSDLRIIPFVFFWAIVCYVAAVDVYYSIHTQSTLLQDELNPMGVWLIRLDGGSIGLFMACKLAGTSFVLCIVPLLFLYRRWLGYFVMLVAASFMGGLYCFLKWG